MKNAFWLVKSDPPWLQLSSETNKPWLGHVGLARDVMMSADLRTQATSFSVKTNNIWSVISQSKLVFSEGFCPSIAPFLPRYMWRRAVCPRVVWCTKPDGSLELMAHSLLRWPWRDCAAPQHCPLELWEMEELFWKVVRDEYLNQWSWGLIGLSSHFFNGMMVEIY